MDIKRIRNKGTLANEAYFVLKEAIITLEVKPGELLLEEDLSRTLGISRTPIRSALQRLSHDDLVVLSSKGAYVADLSATTFFEIFAIRETLELLAVQQAALHRSESNLEEMRVIMKKQSEAVHQPTLPTKEFLNLDCDLHRCIAESSKNYRLVKHLHQINETFTRYLHYTIFEYRATTVIKEHGELVKYIESRDSYNAQNQMKLHLNGAKDSVLLSLLQQSPTEFYK